MKDQMIQSLKSRFAGIEESRLLSVATLTDPSFKDHFLVVILQILVRKTYYKKK